jgi:hypothetical protein
MAGLPMSGMPFGNTADGQLPMEDTDENDDILSFVTDDASLSGGPTDDEDEFDGQRGQQDAVPKQEAREEFKDEMDKKPVVVKLENHAAVKSVIGQRSEAPRGLVEVKREPGSSAHVKPQISRPIPPAANRGVGLCGPAPPGYVPQPMASVPRGSRVKQEVRGTGHTANKPVVKTQLRNASSAAGAVVPSMPFQPGLPMQAQMAFQPAVR